MTIKALRENIVLVAGIALPVVMIVLFWLASIIPAYTVPRPQYSLLYVTKYYNDSVRIEVRNKKLVVRKSLNPSSVLPELYIWDAKTLSSRQVPLDMTALPGTSPDVENLVSMQVKNTENFVVDSATKAPDGYEYRDSEYYNGGLLSGLFFGGYGNSRPAIVKDSRKIKLSSEPAYNTKFIGWIISQ